MIVWSNFRAGARGRCFFNPQDAFSSREAGSARRRSLRTGFELTDKSSNLANADVLRLPTGKFPAAIIMKMSVGSSKVLFVLNGMRNSCRSEDDSLIGE